MLYEDYNYYIDNLETLKQQYNNKLIIIKDKQVVGFYDTEQAAILASLSKYEIGTFLIQYVSDDKSSYTLFVNYRRRLCQNKRHIPASQSQSNVYLTSIRE